MEQPNLSYINELSRGDDAFRDKLISIVKTEFPHEKAQYFENFESKNFRETAQNVHKLKHKISILGLEKSYTIAENYENSLRESNISGHEVFNEILQIMTDYLETL